MKINSAKYKQAFTKFKKIVENKIGKIDWKKVGKVSLAILLVASFMGLLGPHAQTLSVFIIKAHALV